MGRQGWIYAVRKLGMAIVLIVLSVSLLLPFFYSMVHTKEAPKAENGILDLTRWDLEKDGPIRLDGEWVLIWREPQISPLMSSSETSSSLLVDVPGAWNGYTVAGGKLPAQGKATYRLLIRLGAPEATNTKYERYALRMPALTASYELFVNGEPLNETDEEDRSRSEPTPAYRSGLVSFHSGGPEIEISMRVNNMHHAKGGIRNSIEFGLMKDVSTRKELAANFDTMLIGSLVIMGLYHTLLYVVRRKEPSMLFFGLFCILISIRMSLLGEVVLTKLIPGLPWLAGIKVEYVATSLAIVLFILFLSSFLPMDRIRYVDRAINLIGVAVTLVIVLAGANAFRWLLTPLQLFILLGMGYVLVVVSRAYARNREGSIIIFIACWSFAAAIFNDILFAQGWIQTTDRMAGYGLLIFIFFNAVLLAIRLSRAYVNEENLSAELTKLNGNLNEMIRERTADLEKANKALLLKNEELSRLERSRSHLLSNISHDLGTPLTTIQAYLEAIMDGMIDEEEQRNRYLRIIHSKVLSMDRLIEDLFQLTQLEARQVTFKMQPIRTDRLVQLLYGRYEIDVRSAGLEYTLSYSGPDEGEEGYSQVEVDVERLHQVFSNLIFNAIKFTEEGGSIHVDMKDDGRQMLCRVIDSGLGIPADDLHYIFDRFYTASKSRTNGSSTGGKGLGLSISKEIIESHGGSIWLEWTEPGRGAAFAFTIPVVKRKLPEQPKAPNKA